MQTTKRILKAVLGSVKSWWILFFHKKISHEHIYDTYFSPWLSGFSNTSFCSAEFISLKTNGAVVMGATTGTPYNSSFRWALAMADMNLVPFSLEKLPRLLPYKRDHFRELGSRNPRVPLSRSFLYLFSCTKPLVHVFVCVVSHSGLIICNKRVRHPSDSCCLCAALSLLWSDGHAPNPT